MEEVAQFAVTKLAIPSRSKKYCRNYFKNESDGELLDGENPNLAYFF
jgi:hypothetical protein